MRESGSPSEGRRLLGMSLTVAIVVITAAVALGFAGFGLWKLGWAATNANAQQQYQLSKKNARRQSDIVNNTYNVVQGRIQTMGNKIEQIDGLIIGMAGNPDAAAMQAQADRLGDDVCSIDLLIPPHTALPQGLGPWVKRNCLDGNLSPSSPVRSGKGT